MPGVYQEGKVACCVFSIMRWKICERAELKDKGKKTWNVKDLEKEVKRFFWGEEVTEF